MNVRPLASLTATLLARKGQAKPAMRSQGFGAFGRPQEDLGWDDMGLDGPTVAPEPPVVVRQQEELATQLAKPARPSRQPRTAKGQVVEKSAFTLRLDKERHLRLRLASAVRHLSSQQLVTQALDAFLDDMPELEELVVRSNARPGRK